MILIFCGCKKKITSKICCILELYDEKTTAEEKGTFLD